MQEPPARYFYSRPVLLCLLVMDPCFRKMKVKFHTGPSTNRRATAFLSARKLQFPFFLERYKALF